MSSPACVFATNDRKSTTPLFLSSSFFCRPNVLSSRLEKKHTLSQQLRNSLEKRVWDGPLGAID